MTFNFNGTNIETVKYNGTLLDKLIYNGVTVWENWKLVTGETKIASGSVGAWDSSSVVSKTYTIPSNTKPSKVRMDVSLTHNAADPMNYYIKAIVKLSDGSSVTAYNTQASLGVHQSLTLKPTINLSDTIADLSKITSIDFSVQCAYTDISMNVYLTEWYQKGA